MGLSTTARRAAQYLLLLASCFLTGWVALKWADRATATLAFWPAAGIAAYGVTRLGLRGAWAVAAGLLPAFMLRDLDLAPSLILAAGNAAAAALAATWLIRRLPRPGEGNLALMGELLLVLAATSLVAASATMVASAFWQASSLATTLRVGAGAFLAHYAGVLVVGTVLNRWLRERRPGAAPLRLRDHLHLAATLAAIAGLGWLIFFGTGGSPIRTWHLYPLLIWAALAFRMRGASAAMLVIAVLAAVGTTSGAGPFGVISRGTWGAILLAQQFVVVTSLVIFLVAEVADERRALGPLRAARRRFDFALDAAGMVGWEFDAADGTIRPFGNTEAFYGRPILTGSDLIGALHPDDRKDTIRKVRAALEPGGPEFDTEYRVMMPDGDVRHVLARGRALDPDGAAPTLSGIALDVTDRRRDEERQALLMAELDHRVKNILATIQALISRTATDKTSVAELAQTLKGRVQAMARAHSMLARNRWEGASLHGLLADELEPYGPERVAVLGPEVQLTPRAALSLSLVLHELATNAAKYGALSAPGGKLAIGWAIEATGPLLVIDWNERGGPAVTSAPARKGFGTVMTSRVIQHEFGGKLVADYAREGLSFRISLPLARIGRAGRATGDGMALPAASPPAAAVTALVGKRVLVVEDSPLVADAAEMLLRAAGARVVGPFAALGPARAAVVAEPPDLALLDINLGDEMVFPLADQLAGLKVPFAFATGYGDDTVVPAHLRDRPRVVKPCDETAVLGTLARLLTAESEQRAFRSVR